MWIRIKSNESIEKKREIILLNITLTINWIIQCKYEQRNNSNSVDKDENELIEYKLWPKKKYSIIGQSWNLLLGVGQSDGLVWPDLAEG